MAQTTKPAKETLAQQRQVRLAAELRSNLRKRKQQARSHTQREDSADFAPGSDGASKRPGGRQGEFA